MTLAKLNVWQERSQERILSLKLMMEEIHRRSGYKTWQTIADEIAELKGLGSPISHDMLRHYAAGTKSVSQRKIFAIAMMAKELKYAGNRCSNVIAAASVKDQRWFGLSTEEYGAIANELNKFNIANNRSKKRSLLRLEKSIINASRYGLSDLDLMYAVLIMIRRIIPLDEQSGGGGIVDPRCISEIYGSLSTEPVWIESKIIPWYAKKID